MSQGSKGNFGHNLGEDEAWMLRLKDGNDSALNVLMQRWQKPLISFLYRQTGNREAALDLSQEVFVRIYKSRSSYEVTGKFSTWLFTIAVNLSRNHAQWKKRHPEAFWDTNVGGREEMMDPHDPPDVASSKVDRALKVQKTIAQLPYDLRATILLFEFEELSYAEISIILGCSVKAVETRLYRARRRLRADLMEFIKEEI